MAGLRIYRTLFILVILYTAQIDSQKILSDRKKCGDPQCESLIMRVSAKRDYSGPDCRFLTFKTGEEINVYYKLSGRREDLWQGSTGKAYGFFPKETVTIEEVYLREEIEIPAKEIDFVCLDGGEYFFENEDSVLHHREEDREDPMGRALQKGAHLSEDSPDIIIQETTEPEAPVKESWAPSDITGWFGMGKTTENKDTETDTKSKSLETKNEEMEPEKQPEEAPAEKPGWIGGRLKKFLPFGVQKDESQTKDDEELRERAATSTQQTAQERRNVHEDDEDPKSKWFNFGIRDAIFGAKNEKREELRQNEEGIEKEMTPESQDHAMDSNLTPDKVDFSRMDQDGQTRDLEINSDIQVEDLAVTGTLDKDGHAEEELKNLKDVRESKDHLEDTLTEMDGTSQTEEGKKLKYQGEHLPQASGSGQVDESRKVVAKNTDVSEDSETLLQEIDVNGLKHEVSSVANDHAKNKVHNLIEEHQPKGHLEDALTEMDDEGGEDQKKQRLEEELSGSGQVQSREDVEDGSFQCDVEEASATGGHCTSTKPLDHSWKRSQGAKDSKESDPGALALTVMLQTIMSGYSEVRSRYLVPVRSLVTSTVSEVASLLPDNLQPGADFYGCSWDVVIFTALFGFLTVLMFTCRTLRCIKSRFYAGRECKLGDQVAEALSSKREVLQKLSIIQKQYEDVQQTLQESGHQKLLSEISEQKALQDSLQASNKELEENVAKLEQDLEEEKQRGSELDSTLAELNEKIKALEESFRKETSQKEETRTTQKVYEINKGRLESSLQDAAEEKSHLEESIKQLSKEAEGWEERFSELSENSRILSSSVGVMQEDLDSKQSQIKSLIDNLLSLKDWSSELDEINNEEDSDILSNIKWDFENGEPLGDPQKQRIKKLIYAAMLNASLKSVESEKKHLCDNLSDEMKAKEQLAECITNLQNTSQSLSHEKSQLEEEVEKLKQKMSVMMEVYQENERKLHRKLTVQEKERIQKEAKLSKADEKMNMAASELVNVKTRVSELEEEMDRTVSSYQNQVTSYEKKSHDNWLTSRAAERYLSDVKKETAHLRQKLTEAEYKLELLEKDPFALDVIQAIGRENSPFGLSPINRHPESRPFLSPPTLMEGPLRLSPMLPAADRGVRPPGYYPGYPGPKERGDVNSDRRADHQRTLSDAGSLSPPWDREQRNNVPPPGLPYPEPPFPPRRADRFYHYPPPSGRFSGPAELTRNQGRPFMDPQDGRSSPEYKARISTSRNGEEEANNVSTASSQDNEVMDGPPGEFPMHPPPPMRVPLLPRDPRAPYFRRPLMPPPPMDMYGPPGYPGMPPPHIPMRNPVLPPPQQHHYPPYPMHGEAYFPPQPIRPPARSDPTLDSAPPPASSLPPQDKLPEPTT
ncbi:melanoma inhibitory activity protein 2 isoform X1 [Dendropsophus ebraccatus]|uniref:melanoma inhibitory activity protein 2 isoform X1 n=1 Tax=Dendropsophus ebraccatus TaxID=150705 RepID=UPI0038321FB6